MTLSEDIRPAHAPRARRRMTALLLGATLIASGGVVALGAPAVAADCATVPWMDTSKTADQRAEALLAASSQHQKYRWLVEQPANSPTQTTWSGGVVYPAQVECTPTVIYANGAEGVHNRAGTTAWPAPIGMAATWNLELGEAKGAAHGRETFDNRSAVVLGPGIASHRNPLNGRNPEYFGEDPLLSGLSAAVNVKGLEEGNPDKPVIANLKHYVANEQEFDKELSTSNIDERTFRQVYDLPYEIAVKESDPNSVMCSYNQINGIYACENPVLTTSLRDEMGFTGYTMSDFGAVHSTAASLMAGMDQELNRPVYFTPALLDAALAAGEITQARIDEAAFRVVRAYIDGGLFDHPIPAVRVPDTSTPAHKALALELAEQSIVLLKNDDVLPLAAEPLKVAVIGQTASLTPTGGVTARQGCSQFLPFGSAGTVLNCTAMTAPLTAITEKVTAAGGEVLYNNGADPVAAAAVAAEADVAIVFGYTKMGEDNDMPNYRLSVNGDALITSVAAAAEKTVVVLNTGSGVEMPWLGDVDAVFNAWYSGEKGGVALANLLWGDANPSGKLPVTFPKSIAESPVGGSPERFPGIFADGSITRPAGSEEIRQINYTEGLENGYKWYDENGVDPQFEFGFGLSYTSFEYSGLEIEHSDDPVTGEVHSTVSFTVKNTGAVAGSEIPQVYLSLPAAAEEPGKRLVGFDRVDLAAGESTRVEVEVDSTASNQPFSIWDVEADKWTVLDGEYEFSVGASSRDLRLSEDVLVDRIAPEIVSITLDRSQKVVVEATDELSGVALIEYSTQKNKQEASPWTEYTAPLQVDAKSTVSFRVTDASGNVTEAVEVNRKDLR
ncbi:beta-glucosidase [Microbacterium atlanticum]|uniref:beta-glucosidase n=1 Tax=Microbacterium atlanticum TaxID=2782168 RepID=UPI001E541AF8|nr:glycoside hydrolase family 3 C-terminal domain-containing protein [Microbacterium atlanticum]